MPGGTKSAILMLADGSVFHGASIGRPGTAIGEVVFSTSMTGYQEMLTDPSYAGQILTFTYPLVGNYGIHPGKDQSSKPWAAGCCLRSLSLKPSHPKSLMSLQDYLKAHGVIGIEGIDTRALTRKLRVKGVQMGGISTELTQQELLKAIKEARPYNEQDFVGKVSVKKRTLFSEEGNFKVAVVDLGVKKAILENLRQRQCQVLIFPYDVSYKEMTSFNPQGVVFSPGPGDPRRLPDMTRECMRSLIKRIEKKRDIVLFGICLGHQLLAHSYGFQTYKLKFGHRGANHPVFWEAQKRVTITSQNHGFAVRERRHPEIDVSHRHVNDGTVEGLQHKELPIFSVQFHPEAAPGPLENQVLFDEFTARMASLA